MPLKKLRTLVPAIVCLTASVLHAQTNGEARSAQAADGTKNEVIVMGMIHSKHRQAGPYDLQHLKDLIKTIKPDYVLTEIPPDRLETAAKQFRETGKITESRVRVFPEYVDALFPLTKEMEFKIIACAGWTTEMNNSRRKTMAAFPKTHAKQYAEMQAAQQRCSQRIAEMGNPNDPVTIHTDWYDAFVQEGMEPYDRHFNDLIGDGGWTNINAAHYGHIAKALDTHAGEGKRFLITFGSWHKNYIRTQLKKRDDIKLVPMSDYLKTTHPTPASWPEFRGNASRNGNYGTTEIAKPSVVWEYDTGEVIESSPAVVGDIVYIGGHANALHAINRLTGELIWKFEVGGLVRASPSVVDGVVYFGSDDNRFYALDAKTGKKRWDFELGEGGEQSSPAIVDGVVYFGGFDNTAYALNAKDGELIWKQDVGASMLSSPAVTGDSVYIGTYGGKLFSLARKSGKIQWEFHENDQPIFSSPLVRDGLVYFTSYDKHVYGVNESDGKIRWKYETDGQIFSSPAIDQDILYVGSNDKNLYAFNASTGKLKWEVDLGGAVFSSPAITAKSAYVGSSDGHFYAVNREDGSIRWKHFVGEGIRIWTSPTVSQGRIYFGSHAGKVVVLAEEEEEE